MTEKERTKFLPVMKALSKVMENKNLVPSDVNALLVQTRDLMKNIPPGYNERLPFLKKINDIKLSFPDKGDIINYKNGVPHIVTGLGELIKIIIIH